MSRTGRRRVLAAAAAALSLPGLRAWAAPAVPLRGSDVLVVIDVQNCFVPGGSLAVKEGDRIVPLINRLAKSFKHVILTQDWHPADHVSFASQHPGKKPFETAQLPYGTQVLWPEHCVQGTEGAMLHKGLDVPHAELIIRKGYRRDVDSYSAFLEADRKTQTGLGGYLQQRGLKRIFLVGLATDFCVAWSALDAWHRQPGLARQGLGRNDGRRRAAHSIGGSVQGKLMRLLHLIGVVGVMIAAASTASAQSPNDRLEVFYLSAPDCPYCAHWESQSRAALLASPEGKAVRFIEIRGRTLREPIDERHYPPEHRWVFEKIGPSRGVPRFLLAVDGKIVANAYGTGEYTTKFLPALKEVVARKQMEKT